MARNSKDHLDGVRKILKRRDVAVKSLVKNLNHLPIENVLNIVTSWMSLDELETLAAFQEKGEQDD